MFAWMLRRFGVAAVLSAALLLVHSPRTARAAARVLAEIDIEADEAGTQVTVRLNEPVRMVAHAPESYGDTIEVRVQRLAASSESETAVREVLPWGPTSAAPLSEVIFEPDGAGGSSLLLHFTRSVQFEVAQADDLRGIIVTLVDGAGVQQRSVADTAQQVESADRPPVSGEARRGRTLPAASAEVQRLMTEAWAAMERGDHAVAIRLYTKVLEGDDNELRPEAQEMLGLARERNGQLAHAKAEYEEYLSRYPDQDGAQRVQQRLAALVTASKPPEEPLRRPKARAGAADWDLYGSLLQLYRRDETFTESDGAFVNQSALFSDITLTGLRSGDALDVRAQVTGGYVYDFNDSGDNELRVSELYLDGAGRGRWLSARAGRQSNSTGGLLGRFDGGLVGYQPLDWLRINAEGGFPVDYAANEEVDTDRYLYGLNVDLGTFFERLDANLYWLEQKVDQITDRNAVGGELRYFDEHLSGFGLLDYDIEYQELNIAFLLGTWRFDGGATLSATLDRRLSPILTTTNALIGQPADSISELRDTFSDSEIRDLARDRTATSRSATLGGSLPLNQKFALAGDFTIYDISSTDASGGIEEIPGTGSEFYYSTQLIGSSLFMPGDIAVFGVRYNDASTTDVVGVNTNMRFPLSAALRLNPRLALDYRWAENTDATQFIVRPSSRLEYRWRRSFQLELELGGEWLTERIDDETDEPWGYFVSLGYRWDF